MGPKRVVRREVKDFSKSQAKLGSSQETGNGRYLNQWIRYMDSEHPTSGRRVKTESFKDWEIRQHEYDQRLIHEFQDKRDEDEERQQIYSQSIRDTRERAEESGKRLILFENLRADDQQSVMESPDFSRENFITPRKPAMRFSADDEKRLEKAQRGEREYDRKADLEKASYAAMVEEEWKMCAQSAQSYVSSIKNDTTLSAKERFEGMREKPNEVYGSLSRTIVQGINKDLNDIGFAFNFSDMSVVCDNINALVIELEFFGQVVDDSSLITCVMERIPEPIKENMAEFILLKNFYHENSKTLTYAALQEKITELSRNKITPIQSSSSSSSASS